MEKMACLPIGGCEHPEDMIIPVLALYLEMVESVQLNLTV